LDVDHVARTHVADVRTNLTDEPARDVGAVESREGATTGQRIQLFNPLSVISRDGFEMRVSVKVIMRVHPEQAPLMVAKIGSVQNLIDHVIHPMIDSSFRNQASSSKRRPRAAHAARWSSTTSSACAC